MSDSEDVVDDVEHEGSRKLALASAVPVAEKKEAEWMMKTGESKKPRKKVTES